MRRGYELNQHHSIMIRVALKSRFNPFSNKHMYTCTILTQLLIVRHIIVMPVWKVVLIMCLYNMYT